MMNLNLNDINTAAEPKLSDIQGLILRGYNLPYVRYIVFKINDVEGARLFCKKILPGSTELLTVTTAAPWKNGQKPAYCLNVGLTVFGLKKLIDQDQFETVNNDSLEFFKWFKSGAVKTAVKVGDTDDSAPALWWKRSGGWMAPQDPVADGSDLHVQVSLFAHDSDSLKSYYQTLLEMIPAGAKGASMTAVFFKDSEPLPKGNDYIHFGYKDSFSQPRLANVSWNTVQGRLLSGKSLVDDRPPVPLDNFVITIKNFSDAPLPPAYAPNPLLENGSFAAFRLLYQDVKAFNKFINNPPEGASPELVAAKMCGRWFDGTPLVVSPDKPNPDLKDFDYTNFNYINHTPNQQGKGHNDDLGRLCPYAAHIRRTNPRDDTKVTGNKNADGTPSYAASRRIMRRAGPYGPDYVENEPEGIQRGLVGLFICANLSEQFVFIMDSWIRQGGFRSEDDSSPNDSGFDPLFGPPNKSISNYNEFDYIPGNSGDSYVKMKGLERFIRTDGSLLLFLPGIKALEDLSNGVIPIHPQSKL
jgi:deferrochelatase/peroxidase EfeB